MARLQAGYCTLVNPFNARQVTRVALCPEDVEAIVFWTRNPLPLLPYLPEIDAREYRYYFQFTLTGYPRIFEGNTPEMHEAVATFRRLAEKIGPARVIWRYDPIVLTNVTPPAYHLEQFARLADELHGATRRVVISLMDDYRHSGERLARLSEHGITPEALPPDSEAFGDLMRGLSRCAQAHGLEIMSCAEPIDLQPFGIAPGKCIDDAYIRRVLGVDVMWAKDKYQRPLCGCVASKDIGMYDSCPHACVYCYATRSAALVEKNRTTHRSDSPSLLGWHECD